MCLGREIQTSALILTRLRGGDSPMSRHDSLSPNVATHRCLAVSLVLDIWFWHVSILGYSRHPDMFIYEISAQY